MLQFHLQPVGEDPLNVGQRLVHQVRVCRQAPLSPAWVGEDPLYMGQLPVHHVRVRRQALLSNASVCEHLLHVGQRPVHHVHARRQALLCTASVCDAPAGMTQRRTGPAERRGLPIVAAPCRPRHAPLVGQDCLLLSRPAIQAGLDEPVHLTIARADRIAHVDEPVHQTIALVPDR